MTNFPFALSLLSLVPPSRDVVEAARYNGYSSPYSFDADLFHTPRWMTDLPSDMNLTSLSIPGTHDTMTNLGVGEVYQCQNLELKTQLEGGIRYFDIRARLINNTLQIYHQNASTHHSYPSVLSTFFSFLTTHPGETILMRLKEESTPLNSTTTFLDAFTSYCTTDPSTAPGSQRHFWAPPPPPSGPVSVSIPTLGDLRGKILILQNFGDGAAYGVPWESELLVIEDKYEIPDLYAGLDAKWGEVRKALADAGRAGRDGDERLYLSHMSGSVGVLPIEAAAGTRDGKVVGINDRAGAWLVGQKAKGKLGVVIVDFPGRELVREILARN